MKLIIHKLILLFSISTFFTAQSTAQDDNSKYNVTKKGYLNRKPNDDYLTSQEFLKLLQDWRSGPEDLVERVKPFLQPLKSKNFQLGFGAKEVILFSRYPYKTIGSTTYYKQRLAFYPNRAVFYFTYDYKHKEQFKADLIRELDMEIYSTRRFKFDNLISNEQYISWKLNNEALILGFLAIKPAESDNKDVEYRAVFLPSSSVLDNLSNNLQPSTNTKTSTRPDGWQTLFNGQNLAGWQVAENPASFSVQDGAIVVSGPRAHLFYDGPIGNHNFKNFEWKATVKTMPRASSGMFIHTDYQDEGWPKKGYKIQVNQTHADWRKTGSVYAVQDVKEVFVKDEEWYTVSITVKDKEVTIRVNDKVINNYVEPDSISTGTSPKKLSNGTIALQSHDLQSKVFYKDVMLRILPD